MPGGTRRSPPPPRTQRSRRGSRAPCQRLAPPPRLAHRSPPPPPRPAGHCHLGFFPGHAVQRCRGRCGSRTAAAPGGRCWDRAWGRGVRPHTVVPVLTSPGRAGAPLLAATHGATGRHAPQLCVPGGGPPCLRDPPCPPSCFAEPSVPVGGPV